MTLVPNPLENLSGPGKALQKEAPDTNELAGLLPVASRA